MSDFERLDADATSCFERWRNLERVVLKARANIAEAGVRLRLAKRLLDEFSVEHPAKPADQALLMRRAADALVTRRRALVGERLARVRLANVLLALRDSLERS
jgi:hypothetical protein